MTVRNFYLSRRLSQNLSLLKLSKLPSMALAWCPEMLKYHLSPSLSILLTGCQCWPAPGGEGSPYFAKFVQACVSNSFTRMSSSMKSHNNKT